MRIRAAAVLAVALGMAITGCGPDGGSATTATVTVTAARTVTVTAAAPAASDAGGGTAGQAEPSADILPGDSAAAGTPAASADPNSEADVTGLESDGAGVDPCGLVTRADAEVLAATKLDPAAKVNQTCTYSGPVSGPTAQVQVFVGPGANQQLDVERQLGHSLKKLTGVGDEAYAGESAVFVRKGRLWVSVELVRLNDPAENADRLVNVAKIVAGRL